MIEHLLWQIGSQKWQSNGGCRSPDARKCQSPVSTDVADRRSELLPRKYDAAGIAAHEMMTNRKKKNANEISTIMRRCTVIQSMSNYDHSHINNCWRTIKRNHQRQKQRDVRKTTWSMAFWKSNGGLLPLPAPSLLSLISFSLILLLFGTTSFLVDAKINYREKEKKILDTILAVDTYDGKIRPSGVNGTDGPAIVSVNIFVRSISKIDDVTMEYSVQLTFREQWLDERLKFDDYGGKLKYLTLTDPSRVWMPDLFFSNEKEGHFHDIIVPNVYIRIFPEGSVLYSIRISLTLACPMNLKLYPLDKQICSLQMASYGWTTDDLVFLWKEDDPVQVVKNLHLPRFTLEKFLTEYCNSKTNTGEYSCLKVDLIFKREFSYYLIQIYIPCCMLVIVSWVSFWLDQSAVPARISLAVTTLLTMATQTSGINASLPPVSYTKAIDVWTGVCLTFVFSALLEFALVNYASRSDTHRDNYLKKQALQHHQQQRNHFPHQQQQQNQHQNHHLQQPQPQQHWGDPEHAAPNAAALEVSTAVDHMEDGVTTFAMKPLIRGSHHDGLSNLDKARQCEIHMASTIKRSRNCCKSWLAKFPTRSKRIDVISRIIFPVVFALFNIVYWSTYLFQEEKDDD